MRSIPFRRTAFVFGFFLTFAWSALSAPATLAAQGDCSQPITSGSDPTASDCLFILKVAVGSQTCTPECVCAPKGQLPVTSTDALLCLRGAVGQPVNLDCPCEGTTSTSSTTTTAETAFECDVRIAMTSATEVASLVFDVNYQLIYGLFVGDGAAVECTPLANAGFTFSNSHANKILDVGVIKEAGLAGPVDLFDCVYTTDHPGLEPADFRIQNVSALSPQAVSVDATVEAVSVVCP